MGPCLFGRSWVSLAPSWRLRVPILAPSRPLWGRLGAILGHLEATLGLSCASLARLGAHLAPFPPHLGANWGHLGPLLGLLAPILPRPGSTGSFPHQVSPLNKCVLDKTVFPLQCVGNEMGEKLVLMAWGAFFRDTWSPASGAQLSGGGDVAPGALYNKDLQENLPLASWGQKVAFS